MGSFAAVAMFALAAGGISAALLAPSGVGIPGNIITAGHLQVRINEPDDTNLSLDNMAPGEHRYAYQLVTGDMSGVASADLGMTLFPASADGSHDADHSLNGSDVFARNASLAVAVSAPEPQQHIHWSHGVCTPTTPFLALPGGTFTRLADMPQNGSEPLPLGEFTGDASAGNSSVPGNNAVCVRFDVGLDAAAGNEVQATSGGFAMNYSLTQTAAIS